MSTANDHDKKIDQLKILALAQPVPPRTSRDMSVLEVARNQAALNRQKSSSPPLSKQTKTSQGWRAWFDKPVWAGAGSLVGIAFVGLLIMQQEWRDKAVEPKPQKAQAPAPADATAQSATASSAATAPSAAPAPAGVTAPSAATASAPRAETLPASASAQVSPAPAKRTQNLPSAKQAAKPSADPIVAQAPESISQAAARESAQVAIAPAPMVKSDMTPMAMPKISAPAPVADVPPVEPASSTSVPAPAPPVVGVLEPKKALQDFSLNKNQSAISSSVDKLDWNAEQCLRFFRQLPIADREVSVKNNQALIKTCRAKLNDQRWPSDLQWLQ